MLGGLAGRVFLFDAVRVARRSRLGLLRSLYGLLLLVVLFLVYTRWFGRGLVEGIAGLFDEQALPINEQARFAESFFQSFLLVQILAVFLLTPAFVAGAIAEEREKGTLPLLLTTHLSDWEIVLGKLLSRVGLLVLLLLTGVPVLALLQLLGGVAPAMVVAGTVITLLNLITVTAVSLFCSAVCGRARDAILMAYALVLGWQLFVTLTCGSCFGLVSSTSSTHPLVGFFASTSILWTFALLELDFWDTVRPSALPLMLLGQFAGHALITWFFLRKATSWLRVETAHRPGAADALPPPGVTPLPPPPRPPVGERPILWKEQFIGGLLSQYRLQGDLPDLILFFGMLLAFILLTVAMIFSPLAGGANDAGDSRVLFGQVLFTPIACLGILTVALRAISTISGEREQLTLDSLLATDLTNDQILREKALGCLVSQGFLGFVLISLLLFGMLVGGFWPPVLGLIVVGYATHVAFALFLGMYCSLVSLSTFRATVATTLMMLAATCGHWLVYLLLSASGTLLGWSPMGQQLLFSIHLYGLTPPLHLATMATFDLSSWGAMDRLFWALMGIVYYGTLAALLWWRLRARFGPVTGRIR